jgi:hypothetical protein
VIEIVTVAGREHEPLLARFYHGIYLDAFARQREPLETWINALWSGDAPHRMTVQLALDGGEIVGGITCELLRRSHCGLVTYVVVAPTARRSGLGKQLRTGTASMLYADGARAVFGEVNDPRVSHPNETSDVTWQRLERYQRWGSRVVDTPYIQPALGAGLQRDRGLCLLRHAGGDAAPTIAGSIVRDFISEFFEISEKTAPDAELRGILDGIPEAVRLIELAR